MHGFLDELDQAFLTVEIAGTPLDYQIDYAQRTAELIRNPEW